MDASTKFKRGSIIFLLLTGSFFALVFSEFHVSVKNRLGSDDLGQQTVADGGEFSWDFNVHGWGITLYYRDKGWENLQDSHFDVYSHAGDSVRCDTQCLWLVSEEGMYVLNGQTGFWECVYQWPN